MIDNRDMKMNASGYYDETPYKALTTGPKPGDVWVRWDGANMFVIAVNGYICNTLRMNDTPKDAASFEIKHGSRSWWVNIPYVGFIRAGDLVNYEFNVGDELLMNIKTGVGEMLGLYEDEESEDPHDDYPDETEYVLRIKKLEEDNAMFAGEVEELRRELFKASVEAKTAETYRNMYEKLLSMMFEKR